MNTAFTVESIGSLPFVLLLDRRNLPDRPSVYFVMQGYKCLYVGRASNLRHRWRNHQRWYQLKDKGLDICIRWLECDPCSLVKTEAEMIAALDPCLNEKKTQIGHSGHSRRKKAQIKAPKCEPYFPLVDLLSLSKDVVVRRIHHLKGRVRHFQNEIKNLPHPKMQASYAKSRVLYLEQIILWMELETGVYFDQLTPTAIKELDDLTQQRELSRSKFVEHIGRGIIPVGSPSDTSRDTFEV
jgi:hypothetical protein